MVMWMPPPEVVERIRRPGWISLFLDFDGTLAPLVSNPREAELPGDSRRALAELARKGVPTAIVSGRALADVRALTGLPELTYAGNHGLEIDGPQLHFVEPAAAAGLERLRRIVGKLAGDLRPYPGVLIQDKGLTATVHYRNAAETEAALIEQAVRRAVEPEAALFHVHPGKKVWEILPRTDWHKGSAVRWILAQLGRAAASCIYFGDDRTDEDAFRALPDAMTFKVGSGNPTHAKYRAPGPAAVQEFLLWLERQ
jgi:trehalose-phosphatase